MRSILAAIVCFVMLGTCYAAEQQDETMVQMKSVVKSAFLDRSVLRNEDPVTQTDVRLEYKNFGLQFDGTFDLTDYNEKAGELTDINLQLDYTFHTNGFALQLGALHHAYPDTDRNGTTELFAKATYENLKDIKPYIATYWDIDEADGLYTELGVEHTYDLTSKVSIPHVNTLKLVSHANVAYGSSNYNDYYFGVDDNGLQDIKVGTGLEFGLGKNNMFTLTPSIEYYYLLDSKLRDTTDHDCGLIYGITLGTKF